MTNSDEATGLSSLLDFYSDRATAHASFVVAGMFGIYAVLFAPNGLPTIAFVVSYSALLVTNVYSFLNFGYYAVLADITKHKLEEKYVTEFGNEIIKKKLHTRSYLFHYFGLWKSAIPTYFFLFVMWSFAVLVPLCWKVKFNVENPLFWLNFLVVVFVIAVSIHFITEAHPRKSELHTREVHEDK